MPTVEKRSVALSPELAKAVDQAVASGEYGTVSEVIREALRQWQQRRQLYGYTVEELQRLWQDGVDSGPPRPFTRETVDEIRAAALKRLTGSDG